MTQFTPKERRRFVRNGFLVCDDIVTEDAVAAARKAVEEGVTVDPDDPEQVIGGGYDENVAERVDPDPFERIVEDLFPAVDGLVGGDVLAEPSDSMQIALQFPAADATDRLPTPREAHGHLDGFKHFDSAPEVGGGTVAACVYLDDVTPRSGGFTVWPGSHRIAGEYFDEHALETVGGKPNNSQLPALGDGPDEWNYDDLLWNQFDPYEIAGNAGRVVLWHFRLTHTAGTHVGEDVRMSAIKRFSHVDEDEIYREAAADPFAYWPAMEGVDHLPVTE